MKGCVWTFLQTKVQWIPGIGPLLGRRLGDAGMPTFFDLLSCLPKQYTSYQKNVLSPGPVYIELTLGIKIGRNPWIIPCTMGDGTAVSLVFFQNPKPFWVPRSRMWVKGNVTYSAGGVPQIVHPDRAEPWLESDKQTMIVPEYALPKGIKNARFSKWLAHILDQWPDQSWSPISRQNARQAEDSRQNARQAEDPRQNAYQAEDPRQNVPRTQDFSWHACFMNAHFPNGFAMTQDYAVWRKTLATAEWIAKHVASTQWHHAERFQGPAPLCIPPNTTIQDDFLREFSHHLTQTQQMAWTTIGQELCNEKPMLRLLNGDVGSGKTLVAFLAMIQVAASGKQACLMAPTETLIRQHFASLQRWLKDIPVQLILGKGIRMGPDHAPIILGTHALLYDSVQFNNLALVVIDEQQRFGVQQRLTLSQKGHNPHVLFLSATPIPRTFQRLICADMDVSVLDKRPSAIPLTSYVVSAEKIADLRPWIQKCLDRKECVYWVCPAIDDEVLGVQHRYTYWQNVFPGQVGILHGRLSAQEKQDAISAFSAGIHPILVTTTVIEVGVHVSQASTMIIEESPRFGLSQLHQLRGRVGRDSTPGHCFFLYSGSLSQTARQRLQFMRTCQDGFKIAEQDWVWRGSGTILGTEQSGHGVMRFSTKEDPWLDHLALSTMDDAHHLFKHHPHAITPLLELFGYSQSDILAAG
jgi:ATP-dependent DNA helicase RecG